MKKIPALILFFIIAASAAGQIPATDNKAEEKPPVSQRLFFGGSFGLQFGTVTNIEVAPLAGIWLLPRLAVGAGPSFQYYKDPYGRTSIFGGRAMVQITLVQDLNNIIPLGMNTGIFVNGEYEALSLQRAFFTSSPEAEGRFFHGTFLAGAGISQPTGKRSSMNIVFLWSVTGNDYGIYDTPEIRVEFFF